MVELKLDALSIDELNQAIAVYAGIAADARMFGKLLAFGLGNILSRDLRPGFYPPDVTRHAPPGARDGSQGKWLLWRSIAYRERPKDSLPRFAFAMREV